MLQKAGWLLVHLLRWVDSTFPIWYVKEAISDTAKVTLGSTELLGDCATIAYKFEYEWYDWETQGAFDCCHKNCSCHWCWKLVGKVKCSFTCCSWCPFFIHVGSVSCLSCVGFDVIGFHRIISFYICSHFVGVRLIDLVCFDIHCVSAIIIVIVWDWSFNEDTIFCFVLNCHWCHCLVQACWYCQSCCYWFVFNFIVATLVCLLYQYSSDICSFFVVLVFLTIHPYNGIFLVAKLPGFAVMKDWVGFHSVLVS